MVKNVSLHLHGEVDDKNVIPWREENVQVQNDPIYIALIPILQCPSPLFTSQQTYIYIHMRVKYYQC